MDINNRMAQLEVRQQYADKKMDEMFNHFDSQINRLDKSINRLSDTVKPIADLASNLQGQLKITAVIAGCILAAIGSLITGLIVKIL